MSELQTIEAHKADIQSLALKHGVKSMRLFGSVARREDNPDSDFDFLAEFEDGRSLFDLIGLKEDMQDLFNKDVDVLTTDSLHWSIKDQIMKESILISDE